MVKVSVVIPVYNMAPYLAQSVESVLRQSLKDIEIIIVNDGSTDDSLKIASAYAKKDKRIQIINKKNEGLASAYNAGQRVAKGEYIYFLDSDDWMESACLEFMYHVAENTKADVVKANGIYAERNGQFVKRNTIPFEKCNRLITNMLSIPEFVSGHVAQWTCLYRRKFLIGNNIWANQLPKKMAPDIDFMYHVWCKCQRLFIVPKAFIHYRLDNVNSDKNSGSKMSFYLLRGHLIARATMGNLKLPKPYWYVKTKVEFEHFMHELETQRCTAHQLDFINGIAKIFRENLKNELIKIDDFSPQLARKYKFIAKHPFLYWLNLKSRFYKHVRKENPTQEIFWFLGGIFKRVTTYHWIKTYFCGILISKSYNFKLHFENIYARLNEIQSETKFLLEHIKNDK